MDQMTVVLLQTYQFLIYNNYVPWSRGFHIFLAIVVLVVFYTFKASVCFYNHAHTVLWSCHSFALLQTITLIDHVCVNCVAWLENCTKGRRTLLSELFLGLGSDALPGHLLQNLYLQTLLMKISVVNLSWWDSHYSGRLYGNSATVCCWCIHCKPISNTKFVQIKINSNGFQSEFKTEDYMHVASFLTLCLLTLMPRPCRISLLNLFLNGVWV